MGDGLGLHRGVQHHMLQALALDHSALACSFDGMGQQPLAAGLANALAPAHQAGGIAGQLVLEVPLTTEVLPVRVFSPALTHVLVAECVHVLEVQQSGHQPRGQSRPARG
ncbi:hypothetical protein SDC9_83119 [bioreactor metagenome]|uniref:Uncharacterized protein n=1 Tax=bioreactor metagenome TaxID=1076179 RepID=A0A644Z954_9ZZZZ